VGVAIFVGPLGPLGHPPIGRQATFARGVAFARSWCSLVSDDGVEELQAFALVIGLGTHHFHPRPWPHYDLSGKALHDRAVALGATAVGDHAVLERIALGRVV
jgi:hypothetical protein